MRIIYLRVRTHVFRYDGTKQSNKEMQSAF